MLKTPSLITSAVLGSFLVLGSTPAIASASVSTTTTVDCVEGYECNDVGVVPPTVTELDSSSSSGETRNVEPGAPANTPAVSPTPDITSEETLALVEDSEETSIDFLSALTGFAIALVLGAGVLYLLRRRDGATPTEALNGEQHVESDNSPAASTRVESSTDVSEK